MADTNKTSTYVLYAAPKARLAHDGDKPLSALLNALRHCAATLNLLQALLIGLLFFSNYSAIGKGLMPLLAALMLPGALNIIAFWMLYRQRWMCLLGVALNFVWLLTVGIFALPIISRGSPLPFVLGAGPQGFAFLVQLMTLAQLSDRRAG
ncbi:MAG TPA: hypothetical protein VGN52_14720 [Burkholderiales bacterium]|jgi:hypothetical protein